MHQIDLTEYEFHLKFKYSNYLVSYWYIILVKGRCRRYYFRCFFKCYTFPVSLPHLVHSYLYHGFKDINTTRTSLHLLLHLFISSISLTSQMDTTLKNNSCRNTSLFIHHLILPCYAVLPVYKTGYLNEISSPSASLWGMARDDNISTRKT